MTFRDLNLNTALWNALDDLGFTQPTDIQQASFSPIMAGKDVLGIAQTGTGKTLAYLMPIIRQYQFSKKKTPWVLVAVPTRELVVQVHEEFCALAKYTSLKSVAAFGGANIKTQIAEIVQGADVVIGTPGRLNDLVLNGAVSAKGIKKFVLDEVDQMLSLGFRAELKHLMDLLPEKRQNIMFSATMTEEVEELIKTEFIFTEKIETAPSGTPVDKIEQIAYPVPNFKTKLNLLAFLLHRDEEMKKVLVFAGTKKFADRIYQELGDQFEDQMAVIHANKNANRRFNTVDDFEAGRSRVLIASDVLARGIDVTDVTHVINFTIPEVPEDFIHRIGRTGRAEKTGKAISFVSPMEEEKMYHIEELMKMEIPIEEMPEGVEVSNLLTPEEEYKPTIKIKVPKIPSDPNKGAAFHEKLEKNKKVPIKVSRADKMKLKYGRNYQSGHGGGTR